jgi:hypothetical protein
VVPLYKSITLEMILYCLAQSELSYEVSSSSMRYIPAPLDDVGFSWNEKRL